VLSGKLAPFRPVNWSRRMCNSIEYNAPRNAPVGTVEVAFAAARYEVRRCARAAVFARDKVVKLRTFNRHHDAAIRARETVAM
jgi:hypothetical protein